MGRSSKIESSSGCRVFVLEPQSERRRLALIERLGPKAKVKLRRSHAAGGFRHVILMLDGDATGRKATKVIEANLEKRCSLQVVHLPIGTQPDQLSTKGIQQILAQAVERRLPPE